MTHSGTKEIASLGTSRTIQYFNGDKNKPISLFSSIDCSLRFAAIALGPCPKQIINHGRYKAQLMDFD